MSKFEKKVDFALLISVTMANPNGDPDNDNRPRTDYLDFGEISAGCLKRKVRNRAQDMGERIFVQSDGKSDDECKTLAERAKTVNTLVKTKDEDEFKKTACEKWYDVRAFGQLFPLPKGFELKSVGITGPATFRIAKSCDPVEIESMGITKSVSFDKEESKAKGSDTMGTKHFVRYGLYKATGSINTQQAEKTGFTQEDAELLKECLRTLFVNDASAARPDGSIEVAKLYWWEHNNKDGQYSSAKVHRCLEVTLKDDVESPLSIDDYNIELKDLKDLKCTVIEGW